MKNLKWLIDNCNYYDTHAHLNFSPLKDNVDVLIEMMKQNKVITNIIGTNYENSIAAIEQAKKYDNVMAVVGFHPDDIGNKDENVCFNQIDSLVKDNLDVITAIGEIGLDYTSTVPKEKQIKVFIKLIELGHKYKLPIMIHVREAHEDVINILNQYAKGLKIIIHCFTGNKEQANKYLELGCYLVANGIITFKSKNEDLLDAFKIIPLDRVLIETDAPWLAPVPSRGKTNTPIMVKHVFNKLMEIYKVDATSLKEQLRKNALDTFLNK